MSPDSKHRHKRALGDVEDLVRGAVEKTLRRGDASSAIYEAISLKQENEALRAKLTEVERIDDEEITRLWSIIGEMHKVVRERRSAPCLPAARGAAADSVPTAELRRMVDGVNAQLAQQNARLDARFEAIGETLRGLNASIASLAAASSALGPAGNGTLPRLGPAAGEGPAPWGDGPPPPLLQDRTHAGAGPAAGAPQRIAAWPAPGARDAGLSASPPPLPVEPPHSVPGDRPAQDEAEGARCGTPAKVTLLLPSAPVDPCLGAEQAGAALPPSTVHLTATQARGPRVSQRDPRLAALATPAEQGPASPRHREEERRGTPSRSGHSSRAPRESRSVQWRPQGEEPEASAGSGRGSQAASPPRGRDAKRRRASSPPCRPTTFSPPRRRGEAESARGSPSPPPRRRAPTPSLPHPRAPSPVHSHPEDHPPSPDNYDHSWEQSQPAKQALPPARLPYSLGSAETDAKMTYEEVAEAAEAALGCPACQVALGSYRAWLVHQRDPAHKLKSMAVHCAYRGTGSVTVRGDRRPAEGPPSVEQTSEDRKLVYACLACRRVMGAADLLHHFLSGQHERECEAQLAGLAGGGTMALGTCLAG
ncbi:hypothetical protein ACKKBF_B05765 [Auxenochlorella protothecoides x Auxenochlorella symbiontica]